MQYHKFCAYGFLKNLKFFEAFILLFFIEKGLTYLQIGAIYSLREIVTFTLEIPTGIIADSLGRRRSMIFSFSMYIISFIVFYYADSFWILALAMAIFSIGDAFRTGTHKAMILEYIKMMGWKDQKVHYYGHTRSWSQKGSAVSSIIAIFIVFYSGSYKYIFLFSVIPYLLDLLLMISYPKALDGEIKQLEGKLIKQKFKDVLKELTIAIKNPDILKTIINLSIFGAYFKIIKDYLQPILRTFALSIPVLLIYSETQRAAVVIGIIYFVIYIITSTTSKNSGRISEKFKSLSWIINITLFVGFLAGAISGLLYQKEFVIFSIVIFVILYILQNLRKPIGLSYFSDKINNNIFATGLSIESFFQTLIAAIIAPLLGLFSDMFGIGYGLAIVSCILVITIPFYRVK